MRVPTPELRPPRRLPLLLRRAWFGLNQAFRRRIAHLGLTPDQYTVLRTLAEAGARGLGQRELTRRMASDPNTVAALLVRMEETGLIARRTDRRDRRAKRIAARAVGRGRYAAARAVAEALQEQVMAAVPAAERTVFLAQLDAVGQAAQQALIGSPRGLGSRGRGGDA
jgi:DNA-binding MarR family transcriptional regulator